MEEVLFLIKTLLAEQVGEAVLKPSEVVLETRILILQALTDFVEQRENRSLTVGDVLPIMYPDVAALLVGAASEKEFLAGVTLENTKLSEVWNSILRDLPAYVK